MVAPIALHYWPTPNGHKITMALEEMGLAYEVHPVDIGAGDQFKPEFLALSPNNRMPAIVDPDGPDGEPVSIFESGAILQYLSRKTGKFGGADERARIAVDEWLFWQVGGLGPMLGQANHFRNYAPGVTNDQRQIAYGVARYTNEAERLFGVLNKRLDGRDFIAGDYSIADMASWGWANVWKGFGIQMEDFPNVAAWLARIAARPATVKALEVGEATKASPGLRGSAAEAARKVLFGQRGR